MPLRLKLLVLTAILLIHAAQASNVNEPPLFEAGRYPLGLVLQETTPVGSRVFELKGHDPEHSPIKYGIQLTDKFVVDETTGVMSLAKPLDREDSDTIRFRVTLEDTVPEGQQPNIVGVDAYVIVLDENDNPPQFVGLPYEAVASEDMAPGTTILPAIRVTDPDLLGDDIEVHCVPQAQFPDACTKFAIESVESSQDTYIGALVLKEPLDYRERPFYQLLLNATDGKNTNSTGVEIKVTDVQNSPPEFLDSLAGVVREDAPIGKLVMTVKARDGDRGMPRRVVYELVTNPFDYFLLNPETGELRTAKPLDREALDNSTGVLNFLIRARELVDGVPSNEKNAMSLAEATVTIKDVNDEAPTFNGKEYNITIPENIADGTPISHLNMTVRDPDLGLNSVFSLRLEDISGAFTVEPKEAVGMTSVNIRVSNGSLDYENPNQRKFIILVIAEELHTNPKLSSTATVTVGITDVNDNAPSFPNPSYSAVVSETATEGTPVATIVAKDRDSGKYGTSGIVYQLIGEGAEHFNVDKKTGSITVASCATPGQNPCLDFEHQSEYFLNYKATDDFGDGQETSVSLRIGLADANDNAPVFYTQEYRAVIDEGAQKFEPALKVEARDPDKTSKITYSLHGPFEENTFKIDPETGEISLGRSASLYGDDSKNNVVILTVGASDGKYTNYATVRVTIRDVNNHAPVFQYGEYVANVSELAEIGTIVKRLIASDADSGINAEFTYRIQKGAHEDFSIDEVTGVVEVAKKLDYDRTSIYNLQIVAADKGTPSLTGTTKLLIKIENCNDKPPYFQPQTQRADVTEDSPVGTVFATLVARDPDSTEPDALSFAITEPITAIDKNGQKINETEDNADYKNFFAVDRKTGQVAVVKPLDRDVAATVSIPVVVTDTSAESLQQGKGELIITIISVNHFAPEFAAPWTRESPKYVIEMQEEQPIGAIVRAFTATDIDNNIASYSIEPPNPYFTIDNVTGIVRTSQVIDFEKTKQLEFTVYAYDTGVPQLSSSAKVSVRVININDKDPKFERDFYNVSILENAPAGTRVASVKASDEDEGIYGEITYGLTGEHASDFAIDPETGVVSVGAATVLDRETLPEMTVSVTARDNGPVNWRRSTSVPLTVKLLDVNDNRPIFTQHSYRASIAENVSVNPPAPILQVRAVDLDEGINGNVSYKIISGNDDNSFRLDPETGILYPGGSLVGRAKSYNIRVEARDMFGKGVQSDQCDVYIRVISVNQYKPEFIIPELPNATVHVPENIGDVNYLVMTTKAIDRDTGDNGKVTYHLKVGNKNVQETEEFSIDQITGELRSKIILDRETKSKFELVLVAADHGRPTPHETLRLVTIHLIDVNDNFPEFHEKYNFFVPENKPKDFFVGKVMAEDKDEGPHAAVYYYITSGNAEGDFYIDKLDGTIYTNRSFDREETDNYVLTVYATNEPDLNSLKPDPSGNKVNSLVHHRPSNHNPELSHANVTITILDENDNPPVFERDVYYAGVSSKASLNELVTRVSAVDPDLKENGTLQYYIASANLYKFGSSRSSGSIVPSPFNVSQDGKLETSGFMAEYNQDKFVVEIVAKEIASPERFAVTKVHVWIFEQQQLIKMILSKSPEEVNKLKDKIVEQLSNATQNQIVVDSIHRHYEQSNPNRREWCDMYVHVVNPKTQTISAVPEVLKMIDAKYDFLKNHYSEFAIENIVPVVNKAQEEHFDIALAALIALFIVLLIGVLTVAVVCCCLRHWIYAVPNDLRRKDGLIKKQILDELNTTENPLWIEQKFKLYEEQELTMQVFNEPDSGMSSERQGSSGSLAIGDTSPDNTYATIKNSLPNNRKRSSTPDYTTLPGNRMAYETAMGFRGSTFQPVSSMTQLTVDNDGQPQFISGLM